MPVLAGCEPEAFWARFEELTRIARPPRHEEPVIEYVRQWGAARGFSASQDAARNLVFGVPATPGREGAPIVVLQGHLDMVCERQPGSPNDPAEGRIELVVDGEWLTANGTTLGADDGVAIAAMMAVAEDSSLAHGPLQLLMTVAEEVGLEGANGLDGTLIHGTILLNLDSEEDGQLTVGSAGSTDSWIRIGEEREPSGRGAVSLSVGVSGGRGGHSGANIHLGRSNAIKILGRALRETLATVPFRLVSFDGGKSRNAIPRDAGGVCSVAVELEAEFREAIESAATTICEAFAKTDPAVRFTIDRADGETGAWSEAGTARLLDAVALVPTGPLAMSPDFDGLVETSTSLGEAVTEGDTLTLHSLTRSSNEAALPEVVAALDAIARLTGGAFEVKRNYGGWRPDLHSPTLAVARSVYERLFGEPAAVSAVHAGLEPAVIADKVPGLDMISLGPQIEAPHSPDERVNIRTVERFWQLLTGLLDELSTPTAGAIPTQSLTSRRGGVAS
ncbi:MAG TPA: beta-Ala-His dipeptidase [Gaiellaceae bacterium]|nr:beta-Ala-His dipeptidase [Gaiellaceae bacterium]